MKKSIFVITVMLLLTISLSAQDLYDINTITQIEITFAESNWNDILESYYAAGDEERLVGDALVNGIQFDDVGVRYKGNSSYSPENAKNPLNIKLDHIIDDQTYDNYGTLKLANGFKDPSFVRETLSYEIARNYMPASLANYCQVYINSQYMGLYTSVQSVDKYFKNFHFSSENDVRFKGELENSSPNTTNVVWDYLGTDPDDYLDYYELKSDEGWDELIEFLDVFNNTPDEMNDYLNVDNHLWMLAFDNLMVNLDAPINFAHNYYLFQDGAELFNPVVWDFNENLGGFQMLIGGGLPLSINDMQTLDPLLNINNSDYPIINKVLNIDKYQKMYIAHMRTMIEEIFQSGWYETRAYELQDIIDSEYQNDPNTFYSYSEFIQNVNSAISGGGPGPGGSSIPGITELMETRYQWLLNQSEFQGDIPVLSSPNYSPQNVTPNTTVWLNIDAEATDELWLNYRISANEKFTELEMFDDGAHNDGAAGDGTYGVSIVVDNQDVEYYFYAQNSDLGSFLPARAAYEFNEIDVITETGDVVINEINYNSADDFDPEDWVELYNPGTEALDISGWEFKDEDDTHVFLIPNNTVLESNEYIVLCENTDSFSALFPDVSNLIGDLGFGLSGGGELTRLFDTEGVLIDSVEYDDDAPWPTEPDGNGPTLELIDPDLDNSLAENWQASEDHGTPGEENSYIPYTPAIVINEINYNSADDFDPDDWVELYNNEGVDVDISNWQFKDEDDDHIFNIPDSTVLTAGEYLVLCCDLDLFADCFPNVTNKVGNIDFGLSGGGELVRVFNSEGVLVDSVEYDDEVPWPTEPDGNGPTLELLDPDFDNSLVDNWHASEDHGTPGEVNGNVTPSQNIVINEINYNSADNFDPDDWVELYNNDATAIDMSGWEFKDEVDDHVFTIPDNTILGQGEYLVLCSDSDLFTDCFPDVDNYLGDLGYGFSGGGELIRLYNADGTFIDFVEYDDEDPWPTEPDGNGPTLELDDPNSDNTLAENWHASTDHGTPGSINSSSSSVDEHYDNSVFSLKNYPNPFTNQTEISFSLSQTECVELVIYNIKGQKVKTLINETSEKGEHAVIWDGLDKYNQQVCPGIYFVGLSSKNNTEVRKIMLLK